MLTLSDAFELDIKNKETFLVPLIVVDSESESPIFISTNRGMFDAGIYWEDYGLKVDSIKESLDLVNRRFKINNLSFKLSNYFVKGVRFSDFVSDRGLLNKPVEIYYKTQSCKTLDECLLIFKGNIRRFDHDIKTVKIQLEDPTEDKLSKKVPVSKTGFGEDLYNKDHKNMPIPMVYGHVDRAAAIPFLAPYSEEGVSDIFIIPDDVNNVSRDIELEGFQATSDTQNYYPIEDKNPLFIFKDDYFQVLQHYDHSVLQEGLDDMGISNWTYEDELQYTFTSNYISISKRYTRLNALNPPANNELQTIVKRYPNGMKLLTNPHQSDTETDQWIDTVGYGVNFISSTIFAPELAYDNEALLGQVSETSFASNFNTEFNQTYARIPDNTIAINETIYQSLVSDFYPMNYYIQNNNLDTGSGHMVQTEVMSWLLRYSHVFNQDYANPNVVFIRMPSGHDFKLKFLQRIWTMVAVKCNSGETLTLNGQEYNITSAQDASDLGIYHSAFYSSNTGNTGDGVNNGQAFRCATTCSLTPQLTGHWFWQFGVDFSGSGWQADYGNNMCNLFKDYDGNNSFGDLIYDGTYFGRPEYEKVNFPNLWIQFKITPEIAEFIGYDFISASQRNGSVSNYSSTAGTAAGDIQGNALYYDIFQTDETQGGYYLFNEDDYPQYAPILRTSGHHYRRGMTDVKFTALWNGVSINDDPSYNQSDIFGGTNPYFGYWTIGHHAEEDDILQVTNWSPANDTGWFIWCKETIQDIFEQHSPTAVDEQNAPTGAMLQVPKNTLISNNHVTKLYSDADWDWRGFPYPNHGDLIPSDPDYVTLSSASASDGQSQRLGLVFPFRDLDISDEIRCDSYFDGKVQAVFHATDVSNENSTKRFQVGIGAIDVIDDTEDFDWEVFDSAFDADNISLIDETIDTIYGTYNSIFYDSLSLYDEYSNDNTMFINTFNTTHNGKLALIPEFHSPNNYNAMTMIMRLSREGGADSDYVKSIMRFYSVGIVQYIVFGGALDSDMYVNVKGRTNTMNKTYIDNNETERFKYTGNEVAPLSDFDTEEDYIAQTSFVEKPCDILYHFIENEIGLEDIVKRESIEEARNNSQGITCGFSLKEEIKAKDLINQICKDTNLFPLFKGTSEFSFTSLKRTYSIYDVSSTIDAKELIKYSFTRTPVEKINTVINVKYRMDYANDEYDRSTGWVDGYDLLGNGDSPTRPPEDYIGYSYDYLGLDREDRAFEIEAPYIRDRGAAESLRDFMFLWNCNQHNIFKLTLPLKYLYLEVGDIVNFNELIQGLKAYGEDYTQANTRNGQIVYPYFLVSSTNKKTKSVDVELYQLHELLQPFSAFVGSVTRSRGFYNGATEAATETITLADIEELEIFLAGGNQYFTQNQKRVADINSDGFIDHNDWYSIDLLTLDIAEFGDYNQDGMVNVVDIIALISEILSGGDIDVDIFDVNQDGLVNVLDVVTLVNMILGYDTSP